LGVEGQIRSRSSLALKKQVFVLNSPGPIDCDYRQEVACILMNLSLNDVEINLHDRIAQMVFSRFESPEFNFVEAFEVTDRTGGFGSTGI
jgi:dUTP pyrophosphatase